MFDRIIKLAIGDLEGKKEYRQMMKRVSALPDDYRLAFKKIQNYMYNTGAPNGDTTIFTDPLVFENLVELFEASAANGKKLYEVIGSDVSQFADDFMDAHSIDSPKTVRQKLNREIAEYFKKKEDK